MTQLINLDFSGTYSNDFNGSTAGYSSGTLVVTGEGLVLAKTDLGTGTKWARFTISTAWPNPDISLGFAIGTSAGTGAVYRFRFKNPATSIECGEGSTYTTYTTYGADFGTEDLTGVAYSAGQAIGVTFEPDTDTARFWFNVTSATPDSVSSWDSSAADRSITAFAFDGNHSRIGFGAWTSSLPTNAFDNLTAGDFASSAIINKLAGPFGGPFHKLV